MCTKLLVNLRVKDYIDTTGAVNGMEEKFYIFYNVYNIPLEQFMQPLQKLSSQIECTYQNMTLDFTLNLPSKFISTHFISPFTNDLFNNVTTYVLIGCSAFFLLPVLCLVWKQLAETTNIFQFATTEGASVQKNDFIIQESLWHCLRWCNLGHWMNYKKVDTCSKLPIQFIYYQLDISGVVSAALSVVLSRDCISFECAWKANGVFCVSRVWKEKCGRMQNICSTPIFNWLNAEAQLHIGTAVRWCPPQIPQLESI